MHQITQSVAACSGQKFSIQKDGKEIARAYIYIMSNDLHPAPFALMEDVFVDETFRGQGLGKELVAKVVAAAKDAGCYKLIATSRHARTRVHDLYTELGFKDHGVEFRIDF